MSAALKFPPPHKHRFFSLLVTSTKVSLWYINPSLKELFPDEIVVCPIFLSPSTSTRLDATQKHNWREVSWRNKSSGASQTRSNFYYSQNDANGYFCVKSFMKKISLVETSTLVQQQTSSEATSWCNIVEKMFSNCIYLSCWISR